MAYNLLSVYTGYIPICCMLFIIMFRNIHYKGLSHHPLDVFPL